jgi:hypothetical protein
MYERKYEGQIYERDFPVWLEEAILKCLNKAPEDRFRNGKELYEFIITHSSPSNESGIPSASVETDAEQEKRVALLEKKLRLANDALAQANDNIRKLQQRIRELESGVVPLPPQPPTPRFCRVCGNMLKPDAKFCNQCGTPISK